MSEEEDQDQAEEEFLYDDLTSTREAARLLRISESTVWRWINQDVVPSYRVGRKRVWLRRSELEKLVKPAGKKAKDDMAKRDSLYLVPMAPNRTRDPDAVAKARAFQAKLLANRGGKLFPESWPDINEMREERSRDLE
jgi:excisionase family DNA binding protein